MHHAGARAASETRAEEEFSEKWIRSKHVIPALPLRKLSERRRASVSTAQEREEDSSERGEYSALTERLLPDDQRDSDTFFLSR